MTHQLSPLGMKQSVKQTVSTPLLKLPAKEHGRPSFNSTLVLTYDGEVKKLNILISDPQNSLSLNIGVNCSVSTWYQLLHKCIIAFTFTLTTPLKDFNSLLERSRI